MAMNKLDRNINPHAGAYAAMYVWSREYGDQRGGAMDFWDSIGERRQAYCRELVEKIKAAPSADKPHWADELTKESLMLRSFNAQLVNALARIAHSDAQTGEDAMRMRNIATAILHPDKASQFDLTLPTYRAPTTRDMGEE